MCYNMHLFYHRRSNIQGVRMKKEPAETQATDLVFFLFCICVNLNDLWV
jgi:hypothetical protein